MAPPEEEVPFLMRLWDAMPSAIRRSIAWTLRSDRVRLSVLRVLGVRDERKFFTLSRGGPGAIDVSLEHLKTAGLDGDYYEFGVYKGYTLLHAQQAARRAGLTGMRFFGFDSFEGLPEVVGGDRKAGVFISGDYRCTKPEVEAELTSRDFDWSQGFLVEGYFDKSLTAELKSGLHMERAALVMIDCDLYQSTVPVLSFLVDLLQDGTVVLFDDWYCFGDSEAHGEALAFREFLAAHNEWSAEPFLRFPAYGQGFIVRRSGKERPAPPPRGGR